MLVDRVERRSWWTLLALISAVWGRWREGNAHQHLRPAARGIVRPAGATPAEPTTPRGNTHYAGALLSMSASGLG